MFALLSVAYVLLAVLFGGYSTYLLATLIPEDVLEQASRNGRFAGLYDGPVEHATPAAADAKASGSAL